MRRALSLDARVEDFQHVVVASLASTHVAAFRAARNSSVTSGEVLAEQSEHGVLVRPARERAQATGLAFQGGKAEDAFPEHVLG